MQEMEGNGGLLQCILNDCPRLQMGVEQLAGEHHDLLQRLGDLESALTSEQPASARRTQAICTIAVQMLQILRNHYEAGNSLVLEAFNTDIGTKD
jgi:hypothetical protein